MRHMVAAKFETIKNIPQLITERKSAAFPIRAGMMYVVRPMPKIDGAIVEKSVACQFG